MKYVCRVSFLFSASDAPFFFNLRNAVFAYNYFQNKAYLLNQFHNYFITKHATNEFQNAESFRKTSY
jgi:hypothetical protein